METLAYTHFSAQADDMTPHSQPSADGFVWESEVYWKPPSLAWIQGLALAIALSSLSVTSSAWAAVVDTNGSPLNVRSGPGLGYGVVSTLANGTTINLSGLDADGWSQLSNGNWVASRWVQGEAENDDSDVPSAVLRPGSTGTAVTNLQNRLQEVGVYNGPVTGYYGRLTEAAVRTVQASEGLTPDGIAGPTTLTALYGEDGDGGGETPVTNTAVVNTNNNPLNVRSGPGLGYRVVGTVADNRTVSLSGRRVDGWSQLANGNWVSSRWIGGEGGGATPARDTAVVTTNGSPLNVRSGPGLGYRVVDTVTDGAAIATTDQTAGNWIRLANGGWVFSGWVAT
ncbi:MAG: SH3 domain-containing protein [Coleofasciculus sp. D1-CHI-01]|uniref:SH3 domain-containing protein n=1 Tax=Coleofasciculus sp. D1-CHI-01 TaxID=3068482 RepID=UPI0032FC2B70